MHRTITPTIAVFACTLVLTSCQRTQPEVEYSAGAEPATPAMTAEQMEEVQEVLQRGLSALNLRCYQPELERRKKKFEAKAVIKILVGQTGKAEQIEHGQTDMQGEFLQCISEQIREWEFPALPEPSWFTYPVSFSPAY